MTKASLTTDFAAPAAPARKVNKLTRNGEEMVTISVRITRSEWLNLLAHTARERTKIQPYVVAMLRDDFKAKGLPF